MKTEGTENAGTDAGAPLASTIQTLSCTHPLSVRGETTALLVLISAKTAAL